MKTQNEIKFKNLYAEISVLINEYLKLGKISFEAERIYDNNLSEINRTRWLKLVLKREKLYNQIQKLNDKFYQVAGYRIPDRELENREII